MYSHFNYIPHNRHAKGAAKRTLGYNETRTGKDGEEIERKLFGNGGALTREQSEWLINNAPKQTYFFRWILSPDLQEENGEKNVNLWQLARDGVLWLEERLKRLGEIQFIGAEHDDHTGIPHVHAILLIERRGRELILNKADLNAFREKVHALALSQREARRDAQLQEVVEAKQDEALHQRGAAPRASVGKPVYFQHARPAAPTSRVHRPPCAACQGEHGQEMAAAGKDMCPVCGRYLGQRREVALSR